MHKTWEFCKYYTAITDVAQFWDVTSRHWLTVRGTALEGAQYDPNVHPLVRVPA